MYKKNIKPFFPSGSRNIVLIVLVIGVGAFIYGFDKDASITGLGLIIFLISASILTAYYRVEVDFDKKRYRSYLSFMFLLKFGHWKSLPDIKNIALIPEKHFVSKHTLNKDIYTEVFIIKLTGSNPQENVVISRGPYGKMMLEAEDLSKELALPVKEF